MTKKRLSKTEKEAVDCLFRFVVYPLRLNSEFVVWYYQEYSMNEWVERFVVSDEVEERLIHMIDTAKEISPYSKEYVKQQINQTLIKKKQRYIMYSLNYCKNDFDELSNKANDFHEGSRYANAAAKVQDIINYLSK